MANSGSDSVSIFELVLSSSWAAIPVTTVPGIPGPYAVAPCYSFSTSNLRGTGGRMLVTSPLHNSVSVIQVPEGRLLGTIAVGPQPYSAACFLDSGALVGVVSVLGENSLAILDLDAFTVITRISDVPGSRGLHGVAVDARPQGGFVAAVAGMDAGVVTFVDIGALRIAARVPASRPINARCCFTVASADDNDMLIVDRETFAPRSAQLNVPGSLDFFSGAPVWGTVVTGGTRNFVATYGLSLSVLRGTGMARIVSSVYPGIPGAAGVAGYYAGPTTRVPDFDLILVTSPDTDSVFLNPFYSGPPRNVGVVNGAYDYAMPVAPGSVATLLGDTGARGNFSAGSFPLPTTLAGMTLWLGGRLDFVGSQWLYSRDGAVRAPLFSVRPEDILFQVPWEIRPADIVPIILDGPQGTTLAVGHVRVTARSPAILSKEAGVPIRPAVLNQDNSPNGDPAAAGGGRPAERGSIIQIFAIGAGMPTVPPASGAAAPAGGVPLPPGETGVTVGGFPARVVFSGLAPGMVGVWQVNAEIPREVTPGAVELRITAAAFSSSGVTIVVR